jgi:hypothetical protein
MAPPSDVKLISEIADLLDALGPIPDGAPREQKWRTTDQIANALAGRHGQLVSLERVDHLLRGYEDEYRERMKAGLPPRARFRRASYPDRTTVLPLWGSTVYHGPPWLEQSEPERIDPADDVPPALRVSDDAPRMFLSHTGRDSALAARLAVSLAELDIGIWMFETQIEQGEVIAACVRAGLDACKGCIALVTRDSMASLWVLTELDTALCRLGRIVPIVDSTDADLLQLLQSLRFTSPTAGYPVGPNEYDPTALERLRASYSEHASPSRAARYTQQVLSFLGAFPRYLGGEPALALPTMPHSWVGTFQLAPISDLCRRLSVDGGQVM